MAKLKLENVITNVNHGTKILDDKVEKGQEYTILIGPTGSGKSTLANVLIGNKIEKTTFGGKQVYEVKEATTMKIGHKNTSETALPNIYKGYIDCPGFGDTDPEKELQNAIYIQRVFSGNSQKVIIVAEYGSIFSQKAKAFVKLIEDINKAIENNFITYSKQFGLCISKVPYDDYSPEVTNNPNKISEIIQTELATSTYKSGINIVKSLEDRIFFFMKNDSTDSVNNKLKILLPKISSKSKIPIYPVISLEGEKAIDLMINEVFETIISLDKQAINTYIQEVKANLKIISDSDYALTDQKLKEYNVKMGLKLFEHGINKITKTDSMHQLIKELEKFTNNVKVVLTLSTDRLEEVGLIANVYTKSNILAENYKLKIADIFRPIKEYEEKLCHMVNDLKAMDRDWNSLDHLTTSSNTTKAVIITGGVAVITGIMVAGPSFGGGLAVAGIVSGTAGSAALTYHSAKACEAYESSHPQVLPHANELKMLYNKLPTALAKQWINYHDPKDSGYLPDLKTELLGSTDGLHSEYNNIFI